MQQKSNVKQRLHREQVILAVMVVMVVVVEEVVVMINSLPDTNEANNFFLASRLDISF